MNKMTSSDVGNICNCLCVSVKKKSEDEEDLSDIAPSLEVDENGAHAADQAHGGGEQRQQPRELASDAVVALVQDKTMQRQLHEVDHQNLYARHRPLRNTDGCLRRDGCLGRERKLSAVF
ncbi:unnamed protein product [Amoebophrya sp. A25]|nr:unnamed protein product [Amoebophrya sp. A25]|eukprot:GSA25T00026861001.1